jgi:xanthine dehydrogenase accessory factor
LTPSLRLVLCGRGIELATTTKIALASDFEVLTFDQTSRDLDTGSIDQDTAVALLYHDLDQELPWLKACLRVKPFYIGALGSKRTHERRCAALWALGFTHAHTDRIKAPIGMFGPTREANTLALSVVADVAQAYSAHQPC